MPKRPFTVADLHEAQRLRAGGASYKVIAETLGFSKGAVYQHLKPEVREKLKAKARTPAGREQATRRVRKWRSNNPDAVEKGRRYSREYKKSLRNRCRIAINSSVRNGKRGGHEPIRATVDDLMASYDGRCYLCGVPEAECNQNHHADHNHQTGEFRGWTCFRCNKLIGCVESAPELVDKFLTLFPQKDNTRCH